ncbi:DNA-binding protein BIN4-like isoform X1 [Selaginella moellendorffii]|uniref:DNA-binding protein BIN4-like isoform X1 n=1 Tax=Selaginella moellendorffii TaxID=88036 RepID=UPI000D1CDE32|nr:DNA-binding protein BIN4-like isoform X1 [Selaginella moellendorffii]|eukprot:XP_024529102.1 DNA-binding protein BIN4-like isoform X1 [Selaginella moellendorffii]
MAEELGEEAAAASPQWLQDYQGPDMIVLSPSPSPSPERDIGNESKRKRVALSDSDEDEQEICEDAATVEKEEDESCHKRDIVNGSKRKRVELSDSDEDEHKLEICEDAATEEKEEDESCHKKEENGEELAADDSHKPESSNKKTKPKMASSLPLVFPEKISRSKVLLECEGDDLDVSGDIGAVGRVSVCETDNSKVLLDLKGTIYRTNIVASNTFFLVNIGPSEAKVEALMNDFVQLLPDAGNKNVENMIEGTLEGITFDSEDEGMDVAAASAAALKKVEADTKEKTGKASKIVKRAAKPKDNKPKTAKKPAKRSGAKATKRATKKSK